MGDQGTTGKRTKRLVAATEATGEAAGEHDPDHAPAAVIPTATPTVVDHRPCMAARGAPLKRPGVRRGGDRTLVRDRARDGDSGRRLPVLRGAGSQPGQEAAMPMPIRSSDLSHTRFAAARRASVDAPRRSGTGS